MNKNGNLKLHQATNKVLKLRNEILYSAAAYTVPSHAPAAAYTNPYIAHSAAYTAPNLAPYAASYTVAGARLGGFFSSFFEIYFFKIFHQVSLPPSLELPCTRKHFVKSFFVKLHFVC